MKILFIGGSLHEEQIDIPYPFRPIYRHFVEPEPIPVAALDEVVPDRLTLKIELYKFSRYNGPWHKFDAYRFSEIE